MKSRFSGRNLRSRPENFRVYAAFLKEAGFDVIELKAATIDTSSKLCSRYTNTCERISYIR